jgi:hypothetical protein
MASILLAGEHLVYSKFCTSGATTENDRKEKLSTSTLPKLEC